VTNCENSSVHDDEDRFEERNAAYILENNSSPVAEGEEEAIDVKERIEESRTDATCEGCAGSMDGVDDDCMGVEDGRGEEKSESTRVSTESTTSGTGS
jgi:hypothetical protein